MKPCWMRYLRFLLCFSTSAFSFLYFSVRYTKTQVIPEERCSLNTVKGNNAQFEATTTGAGLNSSDFVAILTFNWWMLAEYRTLCTDFAKMIDVINRLTNGIQEGLAWPATLAASSHLAWKPDLGKKKQLIINITIDETKWHECVVFYLRCCWQRWLKRLTLEKRHPPSANNAVQTEMNTIRIVSANMVLMTMKFTGLPKRTERLKHWQKGCVCVRSTTGTRAARVASAHALNPLALAQIFLRSFRRRYYHQLTKQKRF